jgi:signal transduction histidine kinase/CheY-like chemotaxis protein
MIENQLQRELDYDECHHDQVRAIFVSAPYGVIAASAAAVMLAYYLVKMHLADLRIEQVWTSYIGFCAACHIVLTLSSRNPALIFRPGSWRTRFFLIICFAEGLGWGVSPLLFYHYVDATGELFTLLDIAGLAAGAVVAFGPYLPAFASFFLPCVGPMTIILTLSPNINVHTAGLYGIVCFFGIGGLGLIFNRSFKQNIRMKISSNRIAQELRLQRDSAEKANLAKSQFLAAASHDLRQPIHAIGLYIGALRNIQSLSEADIIVDKIESSIIDMDSLFSGILDISRLDASVVKFNKAAFSIDMLIERVCRDQRLEALSLGLDFRTVKCGKRVESDPVIVERILRNLVSNALRYTQAGRVLVGARRRGDHIRIEVWDTGCGIAPEHYEKIFDEFYQVKNLERDRTKGLGLGLAIVKRLSLIIDGRLQLMSEIGKGSCFSFMVPVARADAPQHDDSGPLIADTLGAGLIAFVDDEIAIRDAMSSLLQKWGYSVLVAESGDDLVARLTRETTPDLLICDYRLKGTETGQDVARRVRSLCQRNIPTLVITGDTAPERIAEAQSGDTLVLHKPVPNGKLRAAIISLLVRPTVSQDAVVRQHA